MKFNYHAAWRIVSGVLTGLGIGLLIAVMAFLAFGLFVMMPPEWKAKEIGERVDACSEEEWREFFAAAEELHARTYRGKRVRVRPEDQPGMIRKLGFPGCRVEESSVEFQARGGGFVENVAWVGVFFGGEGEARGLRFRGYRRRGQIPME